MSYFILLDDGRFVSLEDVSKIFVQDYELKQYKDEIYQIISQADHPVLFKPFYMIHPCHSKQQGILITNIIN